MPMRMEKRGGETVNGGGWDVSAGSQVFLPIPSPSLTVESLRAVAVAVEEGGGDVYEQAALERLAPEEHPEPHHAAVRQRQLHRPREVAEAERRADHHAELLVPARARHRALVHHVGLGTDDEALVLLERVDAEADALAPVLAEGLEV